MPEKTKKPKNKQSDRRNNYVKSIAFAILQNVHIQSDTYSFKCLEAILAEIREVQTLCLNIKSAFLTTADI